MQNEKRRESLGRTKPKSFGEALRAAITEEFGTSKAFAVRLSVTPGRVSQLLGGPESIDPKTLESILLVFQAEHLRELVHAAWIREFAPLPSLVSEPLASLDLLRRIDSTQTSLTPRRMLSVLMRQREAEKEFEIWFTLSERIVQLFNRLNQTTPALLILRDMLERSKAEQAPLFIARTLWLKSTVLRNSEVISWPILEASHSEARSYLEAIAPTKLSEEWRELRACLHRDIALNILYGVESGSLEADAFPTALAWVAEEKHDANAVLAFHAKEVAARIHIRSGDLLNAEDLIEELESNGLLHYPDLRDRLGILHAGMLLQRGLEDRSVEVLQELFQGFQERGNFHHMRKTDRILTEIMTNGAV